MKSVADLIRDLVAAGLTQVEISRRTGIPQPRVSRWQGGVPPTAANDALRLRELHAELVGCGEQSDPATAGASAGT